MTPPPPRSTLFPYTTLFRSVWDFGMPGDSRAPIVGRVAPPGMTPSRSEEHTSELQSRGHLVCRLLLEKKKNIHKLNSSYLPYYSYNCIDRPYKTKLVSNHHN